MKLEGVGEVNKAQRSRGFEESFFSKRGFGVTLKSEIFVDPKEKIPGKGHFFDDSKEYKFIYVPS